VVDVATAATVAAVAGFVAVGLEFVPSYERRHHQRRNGVQSQLDQHGRTRKPYEQPEFALLLLPVMLLYTRRPFSCDTTAAATAATSPPACPTPRNRRILLFLLMQPLVIVVEVAVADVVLPFSVFVEIEQQRMLQLMFHRAAIRSKRRVDEMRQEDSKGSTPYIIAGASDLTS